ncbi:MAG TPA: hypothetical protein DG942_04585 [Ruminococcaceae bacterium]|nr:hypothetical protein [Oscillospiraceae bacterium]
MHEKILQMQNLGQRIPVKKCSEHKNSKPHFLSASIIAQRGSGRNNFYSLKSLTPHGSRYSRPLLWKSQT